SLGWLVKRYLASPQFRQMLASATQYRRRRTLEEVCHMRTAEGHLRGDCSANTLEPEHVEDMRDAWARETSRPGKTRGRVRRTGGPRIAENKVADLSALFRWARKRRIKVGGEILITTNPCTDVEALDYSRKRDATGREVRGHHAWLAEERER